MLRGGAGLEAFGPGLGREFIDPEKPVTPQPRRSSKATADNKMPARSNCRQSIGARRPAGSPTGRRAIAQPWAASRKRIATARHGRLARSPSKSMEPRRKLPPGHAARPCRTSETDFVRRPAASHPRRPPRPTLASSTLFPRAIHAKRVTIMPKDIQPAPHPRRALVRLDLFGPHAPSSSTTRFLQKPPFCQRRPTWLCCCSPPRRSPFLSREKLPRRRRAL